MVKQIPKGKQNLYNKIREYIILKNNLGHLGLEPRTIRLKAEYSTIELVTLTDSSILFFIKINYYPLVGFSFRI